MLKEKPLHSKIKRFTKKNWSWIILVLILFFAFYFRFYHIDYSVIGYHNMKETHYLTEARNFARNGFFENGFFVPSWDYPQLDSNLSGAHSDTFPTISIFIALAFMFFGFKLWIARLISILFVLGSILFFYLIVKKLFKRDDLALLSALIMAINPLLIFFGRQVQLINPALFFVLMGSYFYLKWLDNFSFKNSLLFSIPLFLGIITKYTFALFIIPLFFIFPFEKLFNKTLWKKYILIIMIGIIFFMWVPYSSSISENIIGQISFINISKIFDISFWQIMHSYAKDNYTIIGLIMALIGFVFFLFHFSKYKDKIGYRFFMFYFLGSLVWFIILSAKLAGHNYHQYPIMPLLVFAIAYFFVVIGTTITKLIKIKLLKPILFIILFMILLIPSIQAKNRQFDTQFIGLDVAGEFIKSHAKTGERIVNSGHQDYGVLWHADMKGVKGVINYELSYLKRAEKELNVNWLFIYKWGFSVMNDGPKWEYIQNNYDLTQFGFVTQGNSNQPLYLVLRKGGNFNFSNINKILEQKSIQKKKYEYTFGEQTLYYINLI